MRRCLLFTSIVVVLIGLSACSIFVKPTPTSVPVPAETATPTAEPRPYFGPIAFAKGVTSAGGLIDPTSTFAAGTQQIHAAWDYRGMSDGALYTAKWYWNGAIWRQESFTWSEAQDGTEGTAKRLTLSDPNGLIGGEYRLELYLDGELVQSATCIVQEAPTATPRPTSTIQPTYTPWPTPLPTPTTAVESLVRGARSALVKVWVPDDDGSIVVSGSGSLVDHRGLVLTNWHVLWDDEGRLHNTAGEAWIGVFHSPDAAPTKDYIAQVITYDRGLDLAVLRIVRDAQGRSGPFAGFPTVRLGDSALVDAPDRIYILGYPDLTAPYPAVTQGIVSGRTYDETGEWITTDTEVNPGNSGGMALNVNGALIGVPTQVTFGNYVPGKIGYIRPINLAKPLIQEAQQRLVEPVPTKPPPGLWVGAEALTTAPDTLNIRSGPGLGYSILWKAPYHTRVVILAGPSWANGHPWYQVSVVSSGLIGWCSGNYLTPAPAATPDTSGDWIAFSSNRTGNYDVFIMRPDGTEQRNLTQHPAKDGDPSWSPDRRYIAFDSDRGGDADIYLLDLGSGISPPNVFEGVRGPGDQIHPQWAPDGERVVYVSNEDGDWEIFVSHFSGTEKRQLTHNSAWDSFPTWSPDGSEIIFTSARDGNYELYAVDLNSGAERRLTYHPASDAFPTYAPDGSRIAFVSARTGLLELYVADPRNVEQTLIRLTDSASAPQANRYPDWSPDGAWIAFSSWRDGQAEIYIVGNTGLHLKRLTNSSAADEQPAWYR